MKKIKKSIIGLFFTLLMTISVLAGCSSTASIPKEWSTPGVYPVTSKDAKWKEMTDIEAHEAVNMPENVAKKLSTKDLAVWAINYPYVIDIVAYDKRTASMDMFVNRSNVHKELFSRDNAIAAMLEVYDELKVDYELAAKAEGPDVLENSNVLKELFIQTYFNHEKSKMTSEEKEQLNKILERNKKLNSVNFTL